MDQNVRPSILTIRVTEILYWAFRECSGLPSVTIPASATFISARAFDGCIRLGSITVAPGGKTYASIGGVVFNAARTSVIYAPIAISGTYHIPEGVTSIGDAAFYSCGDLTSVTIPPSVTSIGQDAFSGCSRLTTAVFLGRPPSMSSNIFANAAPTFTVYYLPGTAGFSSPTWAGYPTTVIDWALYSASVSPISSISFTPDGLHLELPPPVLLGPMDLPFGGLGRSVGVEYSPDLSPGSWIELGNFFPADGVWQFIDPDRVRLARPSGYYRGFLRPVVEQ